MRCTCLALQGISVRREAVKPRKRTMQWTELQKSAYALYCALQLDSPESLLFRECPEHNPAAFVVNMMDTSCTILGCSICASDPKEAKPAGVLPVSSKNELKEPQSYSFFGKNSRGHEVTYERRYEGEEAEQHLVSP